jgi:hypothetical protein
MPRIAVEFCPCGQPKNHDEGSDFFVTCVREAGKPSQRTLPILGPYATHGEALVNVDRGRKLAEARDSWCAFDAFGTVKTMAGQSKGVLGT